MRIIFHSLDVEAGHRIGAGRCAAVDVRPFEPEADAAAVFALVEACRAGAGAAEAAFAPAGIAAELVSRPGRQVHTWLAMSQAAPSQPLGLVAVVEAGDREPRRFSIAWLLVHPQARRRGIATALVDQALDVARSRGAATVAVETRANWVSATSFWRSMTSRIS
jgi:ribosomal protein S18 acetylase RimI-like enzyme